MLTVHQYVPAWGLPDISPFCVKLNLYLAMAGIPYKSVLGNPRMAPKGKLPYIEDDGKIVADSSFIIDYLKSHYGDPLDAHLTPQQKAIGIAFKGLLEEHFYWVLIHIRWYQDEGWAVFQEPLHRFASQAGVPGEQIPAVLGDIRTHVKSEILAQGTGRHSTAEVVALGKQHLTVVADYLADHPYFLGEQPSSFDASVYGMLSGILQTPFPSEVKEYGLSLPTLPAYCDRISQRYLTK